MRRDKWRIKPTYVIHWSVGIAIIILTTLPHWHWHSMHLFYQWYYQWNTCPNPTHLKHTRKHSLVQINPFFFISISTQLEQFDEIKKSMDLMRGFGEKVDFIISLSQSCSKTIENLKSAITNTYNRNFKSITPESLVRFIQIFHQLLLSW